MKYPVLLLLFSVELQMREFHMNFETDFYFQDILPPFVIRRARVLIGNLPFLCWRPFLS